MSDQDGKLSEYAKQKTPAGKKPGPSDEGVDSMMGRLNLLADETEVVVMSDDEDDAGSLPEVWSLLGKVLSPGVTHIQTIRAAMRPAWGNPRGLRIRSGGDNVFVAVFANKADRDRAQAGTPWMVGNRHAPVLLQDYDPRLRPSDVRFDSMAIWVRVLNLPFEWMNDRKGLKIARLIDKKCSVDVDEFGEASGTFLRAKVAIPIAEPLRRWVTIRRDNEDVRFDLQYEKLPFYCFSCGLIGHGELECKNPDRDVSGKLPFDRNLRALEERRRRPQSFGQAAASASWNSGQERQVRKRKPDSEARAKSAQITEGKMVGLPTSGLELSLVVAGKDHIHGTVVSPGGHEEIKMLSKKHKNDQFGSQALQGSMKAIAYNCRGLGNQPAVQGLLELQKAEDPDILFLSETKLDRERMKRIKVLLGMPNMEAKDCEGRSGGLALLWKKDVIVKVNPGTSRYHIDAEVTGADGFVWRLTGIYGEPNSGEKEKTWKLLRILHGHSSLPWMCFGDFNEILFASEKQGGQTKSQACMDKFRSALEFCDLEDLGFVGDPFTWRNHSHRADSYKKERLDRAVANLGWRSHFPAYKAINGDPRHSDHRPLIVVMEPEYHCSISSGVVEQPKFEARWLEEEQCEEVVQNAWHLALLTGDPAIASAIKRVGLELHSWSKDILGDLQNRIKKAKKDLNRCRKKDISPEQVSLEQLLRYKLERLQDQKNVYWKQRAKAHWLKDGDQNTSFFHACASERRRVNMLKKLRNDDGGWVEGDEELRSFITNYYQSLFSSTAGTREAELLCNVSPVVTPDMNAYLKIPFSLDEIKDALNSMGDLKAPGPDGMPAVFYKRFWDLVGSKVQEEVLGVLNGGNIPAGWNETVIVLIPKVKNPTRLKELRPISLCNVIIKIVTKVIACRLKNVLDDIISPSQSAFVAGRLITDNILIAYETTHFMHLRKGGRDGLAAVKLDMSKAFDRVEWSFLEKIMLKLGFSPGWVRLVMRCVTSVTYRVKVDKNLSEVIVPQRGLRQGCPLSPYLFILCAEGLSALFRKAEEEGSLQGVQVCPTAPTINHLFFADDSLIFMKVNEPSAQKLLEILELYEDASGQMINKDKSAVMFSKGVSHLAKRNFQRFLQISDEAYNDRYLGLPIHLGRSKSKAFGFLIELIWKKIQGWKEKFLSRVGKEILIKAVAQAIPIYAMPCFDITKSFCDDISSMVCRYWWNNQEEERHHWLGWKCLSQPKCEGGLGFRDLHIFNMAMLARQGWRLLLNPDSLCAKVLCARYFPNGNILDAVPAPGISYTWRSILRGVALLKEGLIWRVGDGANIKMWKDPWIPSGITRKPRSLQGNSPATLVADLLNPLTGDWDEALVHDLFQAEDARAILSISICETREKLMSCTSAHSMLEDLWKCNDETQLKAVTLMWEWWNVRNKANAGSGGWGYVIRDQAGDFIAAGAGKSVHLRDALHSEAVACLAAIAGANRVGANRIIFESEASNLVNALKSNAFDRSEIGVLVKEVGAATPNPAAVLFIQPPSCPPAPATAQAGLDLRFGLVTPEIVASASKAAADRRGKSGALPEMGAPSRASAALQQADASSSPSVRLEAAAAQGQGSAACPASLPPPPPLRAR
ncbi:hypothetical protein QYE76_068622 [Lolium multiflorum]|uniref:Reverse transcriptase domain-containing protein n=1 Tax=Lolium multiflorum TaxID=4521 RepID=A0AAD8SGM8_LOLMU|nr:hypothetical protein QYE76_068622 [Lolium multiflorum]